MLGDHAEPSHLERPFKLWQCELVVLAWPQGQWFDSVDRETDDDVDRSREY